MKKQKIEYFRKVVEYEDFSESWLLYLVFSIAIMSVLGLAWIIHIESITQDFWFDFTFSFALATFILSICRIIEAREVHWERLK